MSDPYLDGLKHYDDLETQVNNVVSGKSPNSIDISKFLKNPLVYLGGIFLILVIILYSWSPGFLQDDKHYTKWGLLLGISLFISMISSGLIWWFLLRPKSEV